MSFAPLAPLETRAVYQGGRSSGLECCTKLIGQRERNLGSSASRSPSPTKLNASTTRNMARPGEKNSQGASKI